MCQPQLIVDYIKHGASIIMFPCIYVGRLTFRDVVTYQGAFALLYVIYLFEHWVHLVRPITGDSLDATGDLCNYFTARLLIVSSSLVRRPSTVTVHVPCLLLVKRVGSWVVSLIWGRLGFSLVSFLQASAITGSHATQNQCSDAHLCSKAWTPGGRCA